MKSWRRFRSLSAADRVIVMEAGLLMVFIRLAMPVVPFLAVRRALRAYARAAHRAARVSGETDSARIAWGITAAAPHLPLRTTCLVESMAAEAMLLGRGVPCVLRLGVRPPNGGGLAGHAWVEHEGTVVFGALHELAEYSVLSPRDAE